MTDRTFPIQPDARDDGRDQPRDPRLTDAEHHRVFDPYGHASSQAVYWLIEEVLTLREKLKALESRQGSGEMARALSAARMGGCGERKKSSPEWRPTDRATAAWCNSPIGRGAAVGLPAMTLYLDTEFNGYRGELISMALVGSDGAEWYEVCAGRWEYETGPWVRQHVVPQLGRGPIRHERFKESFANFVRREAEQTPLVIVADWPEDIAYFCALMCGPNGGQILVWPTFKLVDSPELHPAIPHNALSNARALRDAYERKAG